MAKVIRLTEKELNNIVKRVVQESEMEEGIFDPITSRIQGLKGVWRGEGYDYFKYLSNLSQLTRQLKKLDEPNAKIMVKLTNLKNKVLSSKMPPEKKSNLSSAIDQAINHFTSYSNAINTIERLASDRLEGRTPPTP